MMKRKMMQLTLVTVLLTLVGLVAACTGANPPRVNSPSAQGTTSVPAFNVGSLTINPPEANPGVQVIITARVTNSGSDRVRYTPRIRIDDISGGSLPSFRYLNDVNVPGGATQLLSFVIPADAPGKYKVTWGESTGEFAVIGTDKTDIGSYAAMKAIAPDFTAVDVVTNQKITLSQFKGSIVLLNFVNYGCDPSLNNVVSKQLLEIRELQNQRSDFVPVSVFCGCCPPEVLRDFARENNLTWPWILDTNNSIVSKYASYLRKYGYPTLIFIDRDQFVREVSGYAALPALSGKLDRITGTGN